MKLEHLVVKPGTRAGLADRDPAGRGELTKEEAKELLGQHTEKLAELQELLWANESRALLVIFQGMDGSGKDSATKHVLSGVNPQGVQVVSFKQPSQEELGHDFLWRVSKAAPERGRIGIFNRSHYEEVLAVRVHPEWLDRQRLPESARGAHFWERRYEDINGFERHLDRSGTKIVKFFLHLSKAEQKQRFLKRLDRPNKQWKFDADRRRRAGALGRVHGRVRRRAQRDVDGVGAMARDPGRPQVARARAHRGDRRRDDRVARARLADGVRGGAQGQRRGASSARGGGG